jgi:hypothetical protein
MGARTNFELQDGQGSIWLYSHWGGDNKEVTLANALEQAKPRWDDFSYAMRIVVSQIIGQNWDSETGFGLSTFEAGEESYDPISVNFANNTVSYQNKVYTFEEFIANYSYAAA